MCAGSSEVPVDDHHRHKDAGDKDDTLEDDELMMIAAVSIEARSRGSNFMAVWEKV